MTILDRSTLAVLLTGTTHYIDIGQGADAAIYYESAKAAHMKLPGGGVLHGAWSLGDDGYHIDWQDGPSADWHIAQPEPGVFAYLDGNEERRGTVTRIVPGDAEGLAG